MRDLHAAVELVQSEPEKWSGGSAGLYGTLSKLPPAFIEESAKVFLDTMSSLVEEEADGPTDDSEQPLSPEPWVGGRPKGLDDAVDHSDAANGDEQPGSKPLAPRRRGSVIRSSARPAA